MEVSTIIPALNEEDAIADAIQRAWAAGADEVIVVDGGSTDTTRNIVRAENCHLIESRAGRALQQNAGAEAARGDVLLFQHADNWLEPGAVEQIKKALDDPAVLGGAFRQVIEAKGFWYRSLEWTNAWRVRWSSLAFGDQGIFMRREFFEQLGGFPQVRFMEDLILMERFRKHARPILLPGPLHVSARRWQQYGPIRQSIRNWTLRCAYGCGVSPDSLAKFYARHDKP